MHRLVLSCPLYARAQSLTDVRCDIQAFTDILEPFCNGAKTEVALINTVQVYCYEDTRIIKAFPQVLKVSSRDLAWSGGCG